MMFLWRLGWGLGTTGDIKLIKEGGGGVLWVVKITIFHKPSSC
jgi:hypothetical protein